MRRMWIAIVLLSALLCVVNVALWARSYSYTYSPVLNYVSWPTRDLYVSRFASARLVQGRWLIQWGSNTFNLAKPEGIVQGWGAAEADTHRRDNPGGLHGQFVSFPILSVMSGVPFMLNGRMVTVGPTDYLIGMKGTFDHKRDYQSTASRTDDRHAAIFPAWITVVLLAIAPIEYGRRWMIRRRRIGNGCCGWCGYDLRASSGQCPECGAASAKPAAMTT